MMDGLHLRILSKINKALAFYSFYKTYYHVTMKSNNDHIQAIFQTNFSYGDIIYDQIYNYLFNSKNLNLYSVMPVWQLRKP